MPYPGMTNTPYSSHMEIKYSERYQTCFWYHSLARLVYETYFFDIEEKSSGSTTSHSNHSLPEYESFCFDHIKETSSGSTTSHSDFSLPDYKKSSGSTTSYYGLSRLEYESFHFDLSIDPLPPADRSDFYHKEFADELAHIISPSKYDYFYFDLEADPR
ncbi:hypothetical protein Tco_1399517 [Tanacetum coccineum]